MGRHRSLHRVVFVLLAVSALVLQAVPAQAGIARGSFHQTNLVSDRDDPRFKPKLVDPDLVNRLAGPNWQQQCRRLAAWARTRSPG